ncbi:MAG: CbrC family protein [Lachnospiraceae bacterium]|nr:CbrC family protein [Lachnospiraceae bacterium]
MELERTPVHEMPQASEREPAVDIHTIPPEEIEPLCVYNILKNDDEELMILVPGYHRGEPIEPEIHYHGGQHAILSRGPHQNLLMEELNPEIRGALAASEYVLVMEIDTKRRYAAALVSDEVGPLGRTILEAHRYYFPFHPYPVSNGTFNIGDAVCDYCHTPVRIYYKGPTDKAGVKCACPSCIENGEMIPYDESFFPEIDERCINREHWMDVYGGSPPYQSGGRVPPVWGVHCEGLGVYLGRLEIEDLIPELLEELKETWDSELNIYSDEEPDRVFADLEKSTERGEVHLFRCSKCHKVFCLFIRSDTAL